MVCPHPNLIIGPDVPNWSVRCPPHLILKHLTSLVVSLAQLVSPSVALLAKLVKYFPPYIILHYLPNEKNDFAKLSQAQAPAELSSIIITVRLAIRNPSRKV